MGFRRLALVAALAGLVLAPAAAGQRVDAAVADLRDNHVTFETGAVDDRDLAELDATVGRLQDDGFFKVVVLARPVSDFPSARAFAQRVLEGLGGKGTVLVYDASSVGLATNAAPAGEVPGAERAATDEANRADSFAAGAAAASNRLFGTAVEPVGGGAAEDGGGPSWLVWLLVLAGVGVLALLLLRRMLRAGERQGDATAGAIVAAAARKVRAANDQAATLILELSDRVAVPDASAEARQLYEEGSREFMEVQDALEDADTSAELEAVYPGIVQAGWKLDSAAALLEGRPRPDRPAPEPLFPAPSSPAGRPAKLPEPGYRGLDVSPWLTQAAMTAMSVLLSRGAGGGHRRYRDPMPDDIFGGMIGGLGGGGGRRRGRPRISLGRGGRGMGSR
mgnify:CR=1 FL=1